MYNKIKGFKKIDSILEVKWVFKKYGIPPDWIEALEYSMSKVYKDDGIVSYFIKDGVCFISSYREDNNRFHISMLKDIIYLGKIHDKVIFHSTVESINIFVGKYGFTYNENLKFYAKGF